jgi:hypothetical protein
MRTFRFLPPLLLASLVPLAAHEPHKPAPEAGSAAVPVAAMALPEGWVESRPPAGPGAFAPMLVADGDGFLATWIEPLTPAGHRVRVARWDGRFWTFPATIRESAGLFANWADVPGVVRAPDGSLYAWWLEKSAADTYAYDVHLARSTDQGASFRSLGVLHEDRSAVEHGFVSALAEGTGVRFYYLDGRGTAAGAPMQLRTVLVEGEKIGPSELVDESVCDCCATAAVGLANGTAVAYRDRTADEIRDVQVAIRPTTGAARTRAVGNDRWKIAGCPVNGPALAALPAPPALPAVPAVTGARQDGQELAVAWFSAPGDRPRMTFARSLDGGATWSPPELLAPSAGGKPMGQLALAPLAPPGRGFAIAWLEGVAGGSEIRLALVDANGKVGASQPIARTGAGRAAGIPRLAAAANRLALLWVDNTAPDGKSLRFAARSR